VPAFAGFARFRPLTGKTLFPPLAPFSFGAAVDTSHLASRRSKSGSGRTRLRIEERQNFNAQSVAAGARHDGREAKQEAAAETTRRRGLTGNHGFARALTDHELRKSRSSQSAVSQSHRRSWRDLVDILSPRRLRGYTRLIRPVWVGRA
jgi:hypothetical protein